MTASTDTASGTSPRAAGLTGEMIIGGEPVRGTAGNVRAVDPSTGAELEPAFGLADEAQTELAATLAAAAFDQYRATAPEQRARFLERAAENIEALGDGLVERAVAETGLPEARIRGERARTTGQLRLFAAVLREGSWQGARLDPALPDRRPAPRVDIRQRKVPLGPVLVFGASNFPLAFSTAGGDTASALAAGCPVIVKAHNAHPGTSLLVGQAVARAAAQSGLPRGTFSVVLGRGNSTGQALAAHPSVKAIAFTGSCAGGLALAATAAARREPVPVYAEMSSTNPVVLLPGALAARIEEIAAGYVASLTQHAGQYCPTRASCSCPRGQPGKRSSPPPRAGSPASAGRPCSLRASARPSTKVRAASSGRRAWASSPVEPPARARTPRRPSSSPPGPRRSLRILAWPRRSSAPRAS